MRRKAKRGLVSKGLVVDPHWTDSARELVAGLIAEESVVLRCFLCPQTATVHDDPFSRDHWLEYGGWMETPRGLVCADCSTPRSSLRS